MIEVAYLIDVEEKTKHAADRVARHPVPGGARPFDQSAN